MEHIGCAHQAPLHNPVTRKLLVDWFEQELDRYKYDFDAFVVTGYSMTILGSILADRMGKELCVIRKPEEKSNSEFKMEGNTGRRLMYIDDCIASGDTLNRVHHSAKAMNSHIVGICLWCQGSFPSTLQPDGERPKVLVYGDTNEETTEVYVRFRADDFEIQTFENEGNFPERSKHVEEVEVVVSYQVLHAT